jgi:hypothetical protein
MSGQSTLSDAGGASVALIAPKWDGTDEWPVFPNTFAVAAEAGTVTVERTSTDGYVSNYELVARFPDGLPIRLANFTAPLFRATVTMALKAEPRGSMRVVDGAISGVATASVVLGLIPVITSSFGQAVCSDSVLYKGLGEAYNLYDWICSFADVRLGNDTADSECNGMSFGMSFQAVSAHIGSPVDAISVPPLCPETTDPSRDTCFRPSAR